MRKINEAGRDLIRSFESLRLEAYPDPGTGGDPWTIGYGHTGSDVHPGLVITKDRAEEILERDLAKFEQGVEMLVSVPLTDNQFSALVSFAFNVGVGKLSTSTLLTLLNGRDYAGAAEQFLRWNKASGKVLAGLTRRRKAERELFLAA